MISEPSKCLQECLGPGKLLRLDPGIATDGKTMLDPREQIDLKSLLGPFQDILGLVTLSYRENVISFCCRNGQWSSDGTQLFLLDKGWVRQKPALNTTLVMAQDILEIHELH